MASVQAAIADIEQNGQHIRAAGGRVWTKADLRLLYDREKDLLARIRSSNTSIAGRSYTARPFRG